MIPFNLQNDYKRYEVFISSTYMDLKKERSIVMKAILDMGFFPTGMEEFPATDQEQFDYIKKVIDTADYYILILGGNNGSFYDEEKGISYTRMEYEYAQEKGIPVLVFVKTDENGEPYIDKSDITKAKAYEDFLKIAQKSRMRKSFRIGEELSGLVLHSLSEEIKVHPRYGWIRDYRPELKCNKELLLQGRLFYYLSVDRTIYDQNNKTEHISFINYEMDICYGPGSQGVFMLSCSLADGITGYNFFYEISPEEIDCFDEDGYLKEGYKVQLSLAQMGNVGEVLIFLSVGDGMTSMITKVFRIGKYNFISLGCISGQAVMIVDYSLAVPIGGQGVYETYVYCEGEIMKAESISEDDV